MMTYYTTYKAELISGFYSRSVKRLVPKKQIGGGGGPHIIGKANIPSEDNMEKSCKGGFQLEYTLRVLWLEIAVPIII